MMKRSQSLIFNLDPAIDAEKPRNDAGLEETASIAEFDDLGAIPGRAILTPSSRSALDPNSTIRPIIQVGSQENGIRLVHALMACAQSTQQNNLLTAAALVNQIRFLAAALGGSIGKVAAHFAEGLARRIYGVFPSSNHESAKDDCFKLMELSYYQTSPYLKFAHFTANQAIYEAFNGKKKVHVVDFSFNNGLQWPPLLKSLALRPGGSPELSLTGVGPGWVHEAGSKLADLAHSIGVPFKYSGINLNSPADLEISMLNLEPDGTESVAVNSVFELHRLLAKPGDLEKVMGLIKEVNPVVLTVVEQEANHNTPVFSDRFEEALNYYSNMFDSLEGCVENREKAVSEAYLGRQIHNVVACEGLDWVERHETMAQWRARFGSAGFEPVRNAFKEASAVRAMFGGGGYMVEGSDTCLMMGWCVRPLVAASAWRVKNNLAKV